MDWGELITRGTAQAAAASYLLRVLLDAGGGRSERAKVWKRRVWSFGCAALWLHMAAAFHFVHEWSHADAVRQTAKQTGDLTGWYWGGGVFINYAFAVGWLFDVIAWWRCGLDYPSQSRLRFWITHAVFGFLVFNATVVFGPTYWRSAGIAFAGVLFAVWYLRRS